MIILLLLLLPLFATLFTTVQGESLSQASVDLVSFSNPSSDYKHITKLVIYDSNSVIAKDQDSLLTFLSSPNQLYAGLVNNDDDDQVYAYVMKPPTYTSAALSLSLHIDPITNIPYYIDFIPSNITTSSSSSVLITINPPSQPTKVYMPTTTSNNNNLPQAQNDDRSFFQKYWIYIVPLGIMLVVSSSQQ